MTKIIRPIEVRSLMQHNPDQVGLSKVCWSFCKALPNSSSANLLLSRGTPGRAAFRRFFHYCPYGLWQS